MKCSYVLSYDLVHGEFLKSKRKRILLSTFQDFGEKNLQESTRQLKYYTHSKILGLLLLHSLSYKIQQLYLKKKKK